MEYLKVWAISLCGALVVTSIFRIIINNSSLNKSINIFLSMFIFLYTVIPLENIFDSFNNIKPVERIEKSYDDYYIDGYEKIIIKAIKNICKEKNVSVLSVNMDSYIDNEGYLCVNFLEIKIDSPKLNEEIKETIKEKLGFEVTIN